MSAIEKCPLFLSAIKRFYYETLTMKSFVLTKSVRYKEVSAIKDVRYRGFTAFFKVKLVMNIFLFDLKDNMKL